MTEKTRIDMGRRVAIVLAVAAIIFFVFMGWLGALTIFSGAV
jgi:hypothetical protein